MAINEHDRHRLHTRLEETLGAEEATTLMSHLPPVGWADVATKDDLLALERVVRADIRTEAANLRTEFHLAFGSHRSETDQALSSFNDQLSSFNDQLGTFKSEWKHDLTELRSEWKHDLTEFRSEWKHDLGELRSEWKEDFGTFKDAIHADRRAAQRQVIFALAVALLSLVITLATR